jgi:hypothetical protein
MLPTERLSRVSLPLKRSTVPETAQFCVPLHHLRMVEGHFFVSHGRVVCRFPQSFWFIPQTQSYACNSCHTRDMANELITAKDKAEQLGISRTQLSRLVKAGKLIPAFKADGKNGVMLFTDTDERVA